MKTATTFKLVVLRRAIEAGMKPVIRVVGDDTSYTVEAFENSQHSVQFTLAKNQGVLVIGIDDLSSVWVAKMPSFSRNDAI